MCNPREYRPGLSIRSSTGGIAVWRQCRGCSLLKLSAAVKKKEEKSSISLPVHEFLSPSSRPCFTSLPLFFHILFVLRAAEVLHGHALYDHLPQGTVYVSLLFFHIFSFYAQMKICINIETDSQCLCNGHLNASRVSWHA